MAEYTIKVAVTASSLTSAASQFEAEAKWLRERAYAVTDIPRIAAFWASSGHTVSYSTEVKGPPEMPLSQDEIRKLRAIITNIAL